MFHIKMTYYYHFFANIPNNYILQLRRRRADFEDQENMLKLYSHNRVHNIYIYHFESFFIQVLMKDIH